MLNFKSKLYYLLRIMYEKAGIHVADYMGRSTGGSHVGVHPMIQNGSVFALTISQGYGAIFLSLCLLWLLCTKAEGTKPDGSSPTSRSL